MKDPTITMRRNAAPKLAPIAIATRCPLPPASELSIKQSSHLINMLQKVQNKTGKMCMDNDNNVTHLTIWREVKRLWIDNRTIILCAQATIQRVLVPYYSETKEKLYKH